MQETHSFAFLTYAHPDFLHLLLVASKTDTQGVHLLNSLTNTQLMALQEFLSFAILHDVHPSASFPQWHPVLLQALADFLSSFEHWKHLFFFQAQPRNVQSSSVRTKGQRSGAGVVGAAVGKSVGKSVVGSPVNDRFGVGPWVPSSVGKNDETLLVGTEVWAVA